MCCFHFAQFTFIEQYVAEKLLENELDFFPLNKALGLHGGPHAIAGFDSDEKVDDVAVVSAAATARYQAELMAKLDMLLGRGISAADVNALAASETAKDSGPVEKHRTGPGQASAPPRAEPTRAPVSRAEPGRAAAAGMSSYDLASSAGALAPAPRVEPTQGPTSSFERAGSITGFGFDTIPGTDL